MANNKIHLRGEYEALELAAASAILPGALIEEISAGTVQYHSTAGGFAEKMFAQEDALQGNTALTTYATADQVQIAVERSGNLGQAILKAGSNYTKGLKLISSGDGSLKPTTGSPTQIIAVVAEAVDLSASGTVNTLGIVRFM